ncbi:MAG TPA: hypothetical protein VL754_11215 [Verrucomicrobiae bacterium]|nr:hypothetical protein [Verrucomicrobiae bacterium]
MLTGGFEVSLRDGTYKIARRDGKSADVAEFCPLGVMLPTTVANRGAAPTVSHKDRDVCRHHDLSSHPSLFL